MTGQHPKTLRTAKAVVAELKEAGRMVVQRARANAIPIAGRRNRDLSRFGAAAK